MASAAGLPCDIDPILCSALRLQKSGMYTMRTSYSYSTSECDSSDQAVSIVVVVVVVIVNFFSFSTSSLKLLHGFISNFVWMFLVWSTTKCVKTGVQPLFFMELWVILCNFWPILKKSSIKPLTRNHSYLVWRVPRGASF